MLFRTRAVVAWASFIKNCPADDKCFHYQAIVLAPLETIHPPILERGKLRVSLTTFKLYFASNITQWFFPCPSGYTQDRLQLLKLLRLYLFTQEVRTCGHYGTHPIRRLRLCVQHHVHGVPGWMRPDGFQAGLRPASHEAELQVLHGHHGSCQGLRLQLQQRSDHSAHPNRHGVQV